MNFGKAIVKFIVGAIAGFFVFLFGYGCLMACNSYHQPTSDGVAFVLWAIFVLAGGYGFAEEDISAAKIDKHIANERKKQEELAREEEKRRIEQEEVAIREKERVNGLISHTKKQIADLRGYELNIMPFLSFIGEIANDDIEYSEIINICNERASSLKNIANKINNISEQYNIGETLQIHKR